jgi:uncharacterized membrane protein YbaN (DUF454 family)
VPFTFLGIDLSSELIIGIIGVILPSLLAIYFYLKSRKVKEFMLCGVTVRS